MKSKLDQCFWLHATGDGTRAEEVSLDALAKLMDLFLWQPMSNLKLHAKNWVSAAMVDLAQPNLPHRVIQYKKTSIF